MHPAIKVMIIIAAAWVVVGKTMIYLAAVMQYRQALKDWYKYPSVLPRPKKPTFFNN